MTDSTMTCPACRGDGSFGAFVDREDGTGNFEPKVRCPRCDGAGQVPAIQLQWMERGAVCRKARAARGETLMELSQRIGLSPAQISAMEQGRLDPAPLEVPS